jgi:hypothetical protein
MWIILLVGGATGKINESVTWMLLLVGGATGKINENVTWMLKDDMTKIMFMCCPHYTYDNICHTCNSYYNEWLWVI